eukprot:2369476-Alexandrium_andersonii.AAC.1
MANFHACARVSMWPVLACRFWPALPHRPAFRSAGHGAGPACCHARCRANAWGAVGNSRSAHACPRTQLS